MIICICLSREGTEGKEANLGMGQGGGDKGGWMSAP